jgi:hypothetical protein
VITSRTRWADVERGEVHMGVGLGILRRENWGRPRHSSMDNRKMDLQE